VIFLLKIARKLLASVASLYRLFVLMSLRHIPTKNKKSAG